MEATSDTHQDECVKVTGNKKEDIEIAKRAALNSALGPCDETVTSSSAAKWEKHQWYYGIWAIEVMMR